MSTKRTHKKKIESGRSMSAEQIRRNKNEKCKQRGLTRKEENKAKTEAMWSVWRSLNPKQQLEELNRRPGKSEKQRKRISEKIEENK